ncbi:MAG: hypothetical protein ABL952_12890, partial [Pyrinomonadaceae bacterium]
AAAVVGASAQCPSIRLTAPSDDVVAGDAITFVVNISGARMVDPTYSWTISAGKITSGQGTPVIRVDSTGLDGQSVTATVEAGGFARECPMSASSTAFVRAVIVVAAQKYDEFGRIGLEDELARLDNFAIGLQNDPGSTGYIIIYGGRKSKKTYAATTIKRMRTYLVRQRGMDTNRIVTLDGGLREYPSGELWLVPQGAPPPTASPTVEPKPIVKKPVKKKS